MYGMEKVGLCFDKIGLSSDKLGLSKNVITAIDKPSLLTNIRSLSKNDSLYLSHSFSRGFDNVN